jgi:hypothetical protein
MSVFESIERHPAEYLPSGDKALLVAWAILPFTVGELTTSALHAVLCLEDGRIVAAELHEIKFDYRYDFRNERWVDVSRVTDGPPPDEAPDVDTDQETPDDGGEAVQGRIPDLDRAGEGDPFDQP